MEAFIFSLFFGANAFWCMRLAERKGKPKHLFFLGGLIPFFGGIITIYLISLNDKWLLEELEELRLQVDAIQNS